MTDVKDDAALLCRQRRRQQFAVLHDIGEGTGDVWRARIGMGEDVAGPQQVEDLRHQRARLDSADVAHHLRSGAGPLARQDGALERLGAVLGDDVLGHAHLGAERDIGILADGFGARIHLCEIDVVKLGDRERCEPHIRNMHEGVKPCAGLCHDVPAEGSEIVGSGIPRRDAGGGALMGDKLVGGNADC